MSSANNILHTYSYKAGHSPHKDCKRLSFGDFQVYPAIDTRYFQGREGEW